MDSGARGECQEHSDIDILVAVREKKTRLRCGPDPVQKDKRRFRQIQA